VSLEVLQQVLNMLPRHLLPHQFFDFFIGTSTGKSWRSHKISINWQWYRLDSGWWSWTKTMAHQTLYSGVYPRSRPGFQWAQGLYHIDLQRCKVFKQQFTYCIAAELWSNVTNWQGRKPGPSLRSCDCY
jgi:hypothetical protein